MAMTFGYAESTGGVRIFYAAERGVGTPLLIALASGYPGASTMMQFEPNLAFNRGLANGAGWFMYDCRNKGRSTRAECRVTFEDLVNDLEAVADLIGEPFDVYGRRDGGHLAVELARRRPESVRRLLLVSVNRYPYDRTRLPEYSQRFYRLRETDPVQTLATHLMFEHPGAVPAAALEAAKHHLTAMPLSVIGSNERAFADVDLQDLGSCVQAPALFLSQAHEIESLAMEAAGCLPRATVANWNELGDGTCNGAVWRHTWDVMIPPAALVESPNGRNGTSHAPELSPRESEILALVCRGLSNSEIGEILVIAPSTAKRHVANIFAKLGVSSRPQAIALAYERGLVGAPAVGSSS